MGENQMAQLLGGLRRSVAKVVGFIPTIVGRQLCGGGPVEPTEVERYSAFVNAAMATVEGAKSMPVATLPAQVGSTAADDLAGQSAYDIPASEGHIRHAQDEVRLLTAAAVDHLAQYVRVVFTEPPALFAHFGIARDGITAAGTGLWLLEMDVDLETRIQRMQALRLKNASEMKKVKRGDTAATAARIESEIAALVAHHGWTLNGGSVSGQAAPSMLSLFETAVEGSFGGRGSAEVVYRFTSGIVHGYTWALRQSILPGEPGPSGLPGQRLVVDYDTALAFGNALLAATFQVAEKQRVYFGWHPTDAWKQAALAFRGYQQALQRAKPPEP